ncbi:MAG: N-6 DNA methylase [Tannerellaceae bacterium]
MFEQAFRMMDNKLREVCSNELDYVEQSSWILFLKYLDDMESERELQALLAGREYERIITGKLRWNHWAAPKDAEGNPDQTNALTGEDLLEFVNIKLFPQLSAFRSKATSPDTIEYKIGEVFSELRNKINNGASLRDLLWLVDSLKFQSSEEIHEMSHLYESRIQRMGNAGRNGGEYYTPRPLIQTIVEVVKPTLGKTVYDGACGSAGFLCEAFDYLSKQVVSTDDREVLQKNTLYGREKKELPYIIGMMNMILHGVEAPNIQHVNTLAINLADIQEKDKYDFILANPPFGGKERSEVQQNFTIKSSETSYLFMEHFIKHLRVGGRAGIVIKNTFLSNTDTASVALRRKLLEECNLFAILDLPGGTFTGAGVKTVTLFFEKGMPTEKVWFYQLNPGRNLGKTNPLNREDLAEFVALQPEQTTSENSWVIDVKALNPDTLDLSVNNPNKVVEVDERTPAQIAEQIERLNADSHRLLNEILEIL